MSYWIGYIDVVLVFVVFAVSLNVLVGYTGIFSVASSGVGALGGYAAAWSALEHGASLWLQLLIAVVVGGVAGAAISLPLARLSDDYVVLFTLASSIVIVSLITAADGLGGQTGLLNVPTPVVFGNEISTPVDYLWLLMPLAVVVTTICWRVGESPLGRVLRAIRDDETATRSLGKRTAAIKVGTFSGMSALTAVAGAMLIQYNLVAAPSMFAFDDTMLIFAMVIVGGLASIPGSIVGAVLVIMIEPIMVRGLQVDEVTAALIRPVIFGVIIVLLVRFRPRGIVPEQRRRRRPTTGTAATKTAPAAPAPAPASSDRTYNDNQVVLEVAGMHKSFGGIRAVKDLSLHLVPGTITGLIGPNGAGKSTVFNLITNEIRPDRGTVTHRGEDVTGLGARRLAQRGLARSFQDVRIFDRMSALENVMVAVPGQDGERVGPLFFLPGRVRQVERATEAEARRWLGFVGLTAELHDQPARSLAYAEQKLLSLARVLATGADILLLDEPLSGVEGEAADEIVQLLTRMRDLGKTICLVEHNIEIMRQLTDRAYFMELGTVTAEGHIEDLLADPRLEEAYFGAH